MDKGIHKPDNKFPVLQGRKDKMKKSKKHVRVPEAVAYRHKKRGVNYSSPSTTVFWLSGETFSPLRYNSTKGGRPMFTQNFLFAS